MDNQYFYIWSHRYKMYWRAFRAGYTDSPIEAGRYSYDQAIEICTQANNISGCMRESMVPIPDVHEKARLIDIEGTHDGEHLYAYLSKSENEKFGLMATSSPFGGLVPMVGSSLSFVEDHFSDVKLKIEIMLRKQNKDFQIELVRFDRAEVISRSSSKPEDN